MFECPQLLSWTTQCCQHRGWYSEYHWHISKTMSEPRSNPEAQQILWEPIWTLGYVLKQAVNDLTEKNQWVREVYRICHTETVSSKGYNDLHSRKPFWNLRTSGIQNYPRAWLINSLRSVSELSQCRNNPVYSHTAVYERDHWLWDIPELVDSDVFQTLLRELAKWILNYS